MPARRRHLEWVQPFLERHLGRNPWIALGSAFLAWSGMVLLVLSLLEVIRL